MYSIKDTNMNFETLREQNQNYPKLLGCKLQFSFLFFYFFYFTNHVYFYFHFRHIVKHH